VLSEIGTPPRQASFPAPEAGDGETVVRVTAAALKPFDRWWAAGKHPADPGAFPQVVGADGVGELPDGRRVAFLTPRPPHGGMAERTLVRDGMWFPVPDGVDDLTAAGPFDLVVDYLWGAPAEAAFAALARAGRPAGDRIRYVQVGMSAGETAALPAMALRAAPVQLTGSGIGGRAGLAVSAAAFGDLLGLVAAGEVAVDVEAVPLADVESAWVGADTGRRVVFVP
jgi:NADPH:quinone reductase-like Zn-dependent oxidoreductase